MAHPIVNYNGEDITCYPGSNQQDEGKLNLESNMARFVTRVTSKNFCIVKPSFELSLTSDVSTGAPLIRINKGQCSINGMDLIMTDAITIGAPDAVGKWYLAFKLARDSSSNVLGDLVYGSTRTFKGLYLTYYNEKPDPVTDADIFYLGSVRWDGSNFSDLEEDEDKYGRIWAEDVLGKFLDPKHPDVRRLNLQEFIYKIPDWYFSKEGDIVYGPITIAQDRNNPNAGILMNVDKNGSHIVVKDPSINNNLIQFYGDVNRDGIINADDLRMIQSFINGTATPSELQKILADVNHDGVIDQKDIEYITNFINKDPKKNWGDTGNIYFIDSSDRDISIDVDRNNYVWNLGKAQITQSITDDKLHIHNNGAICIDAEGPVTIEGDNEISLSTENSNSPKLTLDNNNVYIIDPDASDLKFNFTFTDGNTSQFTLGKALWQYNKSTKNITLLNNDINYLKVDPNATFSRNVNVADTLYIGSNDNTSATYLKNQEWKISNPSRNVYTTLTPGTITEINDTAEAGYFLTANSNYSNYSKLFNNGKLDLYNVYASPSIGFKDNNSANDVRLYKSIGSKILNLDGALLTNNYITAAGLITGAGLKTTTGTITFNRGSYDAYITKDNNSTTLRTSNALYVGGSGSDYLKAGNTDLGNTAVYGTLTGNGNWSTSGTITGSKVYNAVYNGFGERFRKDKDEVIEYGDIVCIRADGLVHKVQDDADLNRIIGICSNTIGIEMAGGMKDIPEDEQVEVEMLGQIWVKTDCIMIQPGDRVKALNTGKVGLANKEDKNFGIALTEVIDGKVRIIYNIYA